MKKYDNILDGANLGNMVKYEYNSHIATITLNDAKSLNAFGCELADEMLLALLKAEKDDNVRVIILTGANDNFSSGGNIKEMLSVGLEANALSEKVEELVKRAGVISRKLREIQKPIIAKLDGAVAGAGFNIALACDFRIATESTRFIQSFIHIGLIPDAGGIYLLNQLIGAAKATELTMLGELVTSEQAYELNLLNKVVTTDELDTAVNKLASTLVTKPNTALAVMKSMMNEAAFSGLSSALDMETQHQVMLAKSDDFMEGITAFIEKRKPNYLK